jgi:hypothetical protein
MPIKKAPKSHTSTRKQASKPVALSRRTKTAASKAPKAAAKSKASKQDDQLARDKRRAELTLRAFQMTYDDYQKGKFHRIL